MAVLQISETGEAPAKLLERYGLALVRVAPDQPIPGSYWGAPEAGLVGHKLYARDDTPLHSLLHEAAHFVCMTSERRCGLDTNAGGDYAEENAVCYLQIVLADHVPVAGRTRMWADMDQWGYSFRLGSAQRWFEEDAEDARESLLRWGIIDAADRPTFALRGGSGTMKN